MLGSRPIGPCWWDDECFPHGQLFWADPRLLHATNKICPQPFVAFTLETTGQGNRDVRDHSFRSTRRRTGQGGGEA